MAIANLENQLVLPGGSKIKDERKPSTPIPSWVKNPLKTNKESAKPFSNLLLDRYIILQVLRQRAKGIVAIVLDVTQVSDGLPSIYILKEARKLGALNNQGLDAIGRLKKEFDLMLKSSLLEICPQPVNFISNETGSFMSIKFWGKSSLKELLLSKKPASKIRLMKIFTEAAKKLAKLHEEGIYFLDMSPDNILLDDADQVAISDFEYAFQEGASCFEGWDIGTPGFSPKPALLDSLQVSFTQKLVYKDVFALGNILLAIFNRSWYRNQVQSPGNAMAIQKIINQLPKPIKAICYKTNLLAESSYHSITELITDLENVKLDGLYG